jgi:chromosome partitioning protein
LSPPLLNLSAMAGLVIAIAQRKGGAGKTTLAAQLALAWAYRGLRVAALDVDPQGSLAAWAGLRRDRLGDSGLGFDFAPLPGWRAEQWLAERARSHDIVLVDTPPHAETEARLVLRAANLVLMPVQPSPLDLWATRATFALAQEESRRSLAVLNRVPPRSALVQSVTAELAVIGMPLATARIGNRIALTRAMAAGRGVVETEPSSPAAAEIAALAEEITAL